MMKEKQAEILLAAVITARATSFIFAKWCLADLDTFNLLAVRFLLAFLLLGVLFSRKLRGISLRTVGRGALMGVLFYLVMGCEVSALHTADTSVVSELENTAIIPVPLFEAALHRRRPDRTALLCAAVLHEQLSVTGFAGIALILLSILVPHLPALANAVKKGYTESSNPERKSVL